MTFCDHFKKNLSLIASVLFFCATPITPVLANNSDILENNVIEVISITEGNSYDLDIPQSVTLETQNSDVSNIDIKITFSDDVLPISEIAQENFQNTISDEVQEHSSNDVQNYKKSNTITEDSSVAISSSALPDISLANFKAISDSQPFATHKDIVFGFYILNTGTSDAFNIPFNFYLDNKLLGNGDGSSQIMDKLPAGYYRIGQVAINANGLTGTMVAKIWANPKQTLKELNYRNNSISEKFVWADISSTTKSGIVAEAVRAASGKTEIDSMVSQDIEFVVANYTDIGVNNIKTRGFIATKNITGEDSYYTIDSIPPKKAKSFIAKVIFRQAGFVDCRLEIYPPQDVDTDTTDNDTDVRLHINFDTHYLGGKWGASTVKQLNVSCDNNVLNDNLSKSDITDCLQQWQAASKVNFKDVNFADQPDKNANGAVVIFKADPGPGVSSNALANTPRKPQNSGETINANIQLFPAFFNWSMSGYSNSDVQKKTLTHEMGHALGLDHPFPNKTDWTKTGCMNPSVMWQFSQYDFGYITLDVTDHDLYGVNKLYN